MLKIKMEEKLLFLALSVHYKNFALLSVKLIKKNKIKYIN